VHRWVTQVLGQTPTTVIMTVAWAVLCLLVAPRVTSAALARALPAAQAGSGRSCLRRVRRWWHGPTLAQATSSPALIRLALALGPTAQWVVVALDTTCLGPWAVWRAGSGGAGRTRPLGWAVLPSPWPQGRCRATTLELVQQLQRACPSGVRWRLVADRGLPRAVLLAQVRQGGTECSVRLRRRDWVTVAGGSAMVSAPLVAGRLVVGHRTAATIGRGSRQPPLVPGAIVVRAAVVAAPRHTQTPGTARERAQHAQQHAQHRRQQQGRKPSPPRAVAQRSAPTWGLCTTAPTVAQAVAEYAQRLPIAETCRAWPSGWGVRAAGVDLPTAAMGDRLNRGRLHPLEPPDAPRPAGERGPGGQQRRAPWTVTDRVSWLGCGQRLCDDPGYDGSGWRAQQWERLGRPLAPAPAPPVPEPVLEEAA
jgi:hypothetical protein